MGVIGESRLLADSDTVNEDIMVYRFNGEVIVSKNDLFVVHKGSLKLLSLKNKYTPQIIDYASNFDIGRLFINKSSDKNIAIDIHTASKHLSLLVSYIGRYPEEHYKIVRYFKDLYVNHISGSFSPLDVNYAKEVLRERGICCSYMLYVLPLSNLLRNVRVSIADYMYVVTIDVYVQYPKELSESLLSSWMSARGVEIICQLQEWLSKIYNKPSPVGEGSLFKPSSSSILPDNVLHISFTADLNQVGYLKAPKQLKRWVK